MKTPRQFFWTSVLTLVLVCVIEYEPSPLWLKVAAHLLLHHV
jgi:hypothetical protein